MSRVYSDLNNNSGIVQKYEDACKYKRGYVSGNTERLKDFTSDTRSAFDRFLSLAFEYDGRWQYDDSNHEKYAEIEIDLVSGTRDYTFLTDEQGNVILNIHKVLVKTRDGVYVELDTADKYSDNATTSAPFLDGQNVAGQPTRYDRTANGIIFDYVPDYSWRVGTEGARGIKVLIDREASYFVYNDTTKKPGVPGIFHDYFWAYPAMEKASIDGSSNYNGLVNIVSRLEDGIKQHFSRRGEDDRKKITFKKISFI